MNTTRANPKPLTDEQRDLVAANLGLIGTAVKRYRTGEIETDDLAQIAFLGLCKGARSFKPELGYKFSTYGTKAALGTVSHEFRRRKVRQAVSGKSTLRDPEILAVHPGAPDDIDGSIDRATEAERVEAAIGRLPDRYQYVVRARLEDRTLSEIGRGLGVTKERARQLEQLAHRALRQMLQPGGGTEGGAA
jgi:RNA polymerase sigma factor (sigma-70 family)